MDRTELAKNIVSLVVGVGTSKILSDVVKNNVEITTVPHKVAVVAATYVIGNIIARKNKEYTDAKIDDAISWWKKNVTERKSQSN